MFLAAESAVRKAFGSGTTRALAVCCLPGSVAVHGGARKHLSQEDGPGPARWRTNAKDTTRWARTRSDAKDTTQGVFRLSVGSVFTPAGASRPSPHCDVPRTPAAPHGGASPVRKARQEAAGGFAGTQSPADAPVEGAGGRLWGRDGANTRPSRRRWPHGRGRWSRGPVLEHVRRWRRVCRRSAGGPP